MVFRQQGSRLNNDIVLSHLDWRIIENLNHNARKKNFLIAKELQVSSKTIKRRIDRLIQNNIIFFTVEIDLSKAHNYFVYVLTIEPNQNSDRNILFKKIIKQNGNIWGIHGRLQSITSLVLFMYANNFYEIEKSYENIRNIAGVRRVDYSLYISCYRFPEWFDNQIRNQLIPDS